MIVLTLPLPPTINHYYGQRRNGGRFIKPAGRAFRATVADIVAGAGHATLTGRIALFVAIFPSDNRRQDLDNRSKSLQDALTHAGVWIDDEQIDDLQIVRQAVTKGGAAHVVITEIAVTKPTKAKLKALKEVA